MGNAHVLGSRNHAGVGLLARGCLFAIILGVVLTAIPARATVFSSSGHVLKTAVAAYDETLLDKVITATEIAVRSGTTGKTATGWGVARFNGAALAPLVTIGITAAGILWSPVIHPWLESHGWWMENNEVHGNEAGALGPTQAAYDAGVVGNTGTWSADGVNWHPVYYNYGTEPGYCTQGSSYNCCASPPYASTWCGKGWALRCCAGYGANGHVQVGEPSNHTNWLDNTQTEVTVPGSTYQTQYQTDFGTDGSLARQVGVDLVNYLGQLVKEANKSWPQVVPDPAGYSPLTEGQGDTVQQAFNDAVDPNAKADLQDIADANGTGPAPGSTATQNDWEYTPEQMAAAQYTKDMERETAYLTDWQAEKPDDGNESTMDAGTYTLPERKDLPGVLDTFKSGISSLPIVSWANGVTLEVTGASSIINLPIPAAWGSAIQVDFADYENILDAMGNGLYALVGMASVLFLFRGRGD